MGSNYKLTYTVDLVFCIDATMSMDPILTTVKNNAINLYPDLQETMKKLGKTVQQLRVRVIAFRDYLADGDEAMLVTDFFELPAQAEDFEACVKSIEAKGGGDDPEDGLEALAYAMKSKWNTNGQKKRHVIVLWSDEGTHDLGYGKKAANYPRGMAADFNELTEWWGSKFRPGVMDQDAKRLLLFTPYKPGWSTIHENWNNTLMYESNAGEGLEECDYETILHAIAKTV